MTWMVYLIKYYCMHQAFITEYITDQIIKYINYIFKFYSQNFSTRGASEGPLFPELVPGMIMLAMISLSSATSNIKILSKDPCHPMWLLGCWVSVSIQWWGTQWCHSKTTLLELLWIQKWQPTTGWHSGTHSQMKNFLHPNQPMKSGRGNCLIIHEDNNIRLQGKIKKKLDATKEIQWFSMSQLQGNGYYCFLDRELKQLFLYKFLEDRIQTHNEIKSAKQ